MLDSRGGSIANKYDISSRESIFQQNCISAIHKIQLNESTTFTRVCDGHMHPKLAQYSGFVAQVSHTPDYLCRSNANGNVLLQSVAIAAVSRSDSDVLSS